MIPQLLVRRTEEGALNGRSPSVPSQPPASNNVSFFECLVRGSLYWFGGIILVAAVFAAGFIGLRVLDRGASGALSSFSVSKIQGDDTCTGLFDYCIRVECTVTNDGPVDGDAVVELIVNPGSASLSHKIIVPLRVGESRSVYYDFDDARLEDDHRVHCTAK